MDIYKGIYKNPIAEFYLVGVHFGGGGGNSVLQCMCAVQDILSLVVLMYIIIIM